MNNLRAKQTSGHINPRPGTPSTPNRPVAKPLGGPAPLAPSSTDAFDASAGMKMLLEIESAARKASTCKELAFIIANETRKLAGARQIFVFKAASKMQLTTISGLPGVDRSVPLVQDIEHLLDSCDRKLGNNKRHVFDVTSGPEGKKNSLDSYPFLHMLWVPFLTRNCEIAGGMLLARETPWTQSDVTVAERLAETYQHALALLMAEPRKTSGLKLKSIIQRKVVLGILIVILAAMAIPVPMSTLAPLEVSARNPFTVSAPVAGVIEDVLINPGEIVAKGQPIVRFSDTISRNRLELAQREVLVAKAQLKKSTQLAFNDKQGRQSLRMAMADLSLKKAELDFAREVFDRATIKAQRAGIAVYSDKQSLIGKPVAPGEQVMQITDPDKIEVIIDIAVSDAIMLKPGARVKVFLDSDPLHSREATVIFSDYQARTVSGEKLAFRVVARFNNAENKFPRIGVRGTAQVFGDRTILAYYLFRRPLSFVRQWIGL